MSDTRSITEPAGALSLAGLKRYIINNNLIGAQKKFVVVISGANMNFDRLRFVAERAELGEGREALLSVDIPERPGRFDHSLFGDDIYVDTVGDWSVSSLFTPSSTLGQSQNSYIGTMLQGIERTLCFRSE